MYASQIFEGAQASPASERELVPNMAASASPREQSMAVGSSSELNGTAAPFAPGEKAADAQIIGPETAGVIPRRLKETLGYVKRTCNTDLWEWEKPLYTLKTTKTNIFRWIPVASMLSTPAHVDNVVSLLGVITARPRVVHRWDRSNCLVRLLMELS